MTIEEQLKDLILNRYGSVVRFAEEVELSNSTVSSILYRGIHKASIDNVLKICKTLGISADELAQDKIVPVREISHVSDISDLITAIKFETYIDGEKLSKDETQLLLFAINAAVEYIRMKREQL